jgi:FtsP/CotA-like multicopper oxidase with cupredoxin domain
MITADMVADDPGTWLFHCHVSEHMEGGMAALYQVIP